MTRTSLEIAAYLVWARIVLKWHPISGGNGQQGCNELNSDPQKSTEMLREAVFLGRETMRISGRLPFHCNCLVQSMALVAMLNRRKIPSGLRLGVRADNNKQEEPFAHAWVECGGRVILDSGTRGNFVPFR